MLACGCCVTDKRTNPTNEIERLVADIEDIIAGKPVKIIRHPPTGPRIRLSWSARWT